MSRIVETPESAKPLLLSTPYKDDTNHNVFFSREESNDNREEMSLNKDTTCGFWIFKGKFLQRYVLKTDPVIIIESNFPDLPTNTHM